MISVFCSPQLYTRPHGHQGGWRESPGWVFDIPWPEKPAVVTDIEQFVSTQADFKVAFYFVHWGTNYDNESAHSVLARVHADIITLSQNSDLVFVQEHEVHAPCLVQQRPLSQLTNIHWIMAGTADHQRDRIIPWQYHIWRIRDLYQEEMPDLLLTLDPYRIKSWYFDAMLGTCKGPRPLVAQWIREQGLEDRILYSIGPEPGVPLPQSMFHDPAFFVDSDWRTVPSCDYLHLNQLVKFRDRLIQMPCLMPLELYDRTCYSIICETGFANDVHMITEKTAKALIARRGFVMFAGAGFLRYLREQGFQTFQGIIDESYDEEPDDMQRWQAAFRQVQRLCNMDQQRVLECMRPIVEHNFRQVMDRDLTMVTRERITDIVLRFAKNTTMNRKP